MPETAEPLNPIVQAIASAKREAYTAKQDRMTKNAHNRRILRSEQYVDRVSGQSNDSLPKLSVALTALAAVVKRGLTGESDWFSANVPERSPIGEYQLRQLLTCFIENLHSPSSPSTNLTSVITDAVKAACTDSLMIVKVMGTYKTETEFFAERGEPFYDDYGQLQPGEVTLNHRERPSWRLTVDVVPDVDYYVDPMGHGMYEIHTVRRNLHELQDNPLYDQQAVAQLTQDIVYPQGVEGTNDGARREDDPRLKAESGNRKIVTIDECWGTLLDQQGNVLYENVVAASVNNKYLIRPPLDNPLWHGKSPFVTSPLIRVPYSVWHKSIYDEAAQLNESINELYNLMFDGGLSSVWGVRQVRRDLLENPDEVSGGIPAHKTLEIKAETPQGVNVVETVSQGQVPQDAFQLFNVIDREFQQAAMVNDVRLGNLPPRRVKATEIIESQQSQSVTIDSILKDLENEFIEPLLKKCWLTTIQFADQIPFDHYEGSVDAQTAITFQNMPALDKFVLYGQKCSFKVYGLSQALNKTRDFQKLVTIIQVVGSNPALLQAFVQRYSPFKIIESLIESLDVNPSLYELTLEEQTQLPAFIEGLQHFAQFATPGSGASAPQSGSESLNNPNINLPS